MTVLAKDHRHQISDRQTYLLLYVDDLILIGSNKEKLEELLYCTQTYLEWLGLNINCDKSKIMFAQDISDMDLISSEGDFLGSLKREKMYKYLGVHFNIGKASEMFRDAKILK